MAETLAVRNVPELPSPILLFMEKAAFVGSLEKIPSWHVVHVKTLEEFDDALQQTDFSMLIALSPEGHPSTAGSAIKRFRDRNPKALTVYHGHDYRLRESAPHAIDCSADVLLVGGITEANLIFCLGTAYLLKQRSRLRPSFEVYETLLKVTCADSGFWQLQDSPMLPNDMY